ncbi:MAG: type IV pili methyl-accepting chemotaxis transducer N-terminal domain-containing protein, partial [Reinekea forsetii]|nr:type IV pili methyl-accepting chemotaxis transducer N-terminal domain-containing protein [Reinekea forsetii]
MLRLARYPIASSLSLSLTMVIALVFISFMLDVRLTSSLSGDAAAINHARSMRMQSYRLAYAIEKKTPLSERQKLINEFASDLNAPILASQVATDQLAPQAQFALVQRHFQTMRAFALNDPPAYLRAVEDFVGELDQLVKQLELRSVNKLRQVSRLKIINYTIALLSAIGLTLLLFKQVISPFRRLVTPVQKLGQGDDWEDVNFRGDGEFAELSQAFNRMAHNVTAAQLTLESRIHQQTEAVKRNNRALELLFNLSQTLNTEHPSIEVLKDKAAADLQTLFGEKSIYWTTLEVNKGANRVVFTCATDDSQLVCITFSPLAPWQYQTLDTVITLFDNALNRMNAQKSENRIALLNERSSIARELHDSLAQSLSYLKIQVARWLVLRERGADLANLDLIVLELRDGLNATYRKLRELLVTFRSPSDELGLVSSVTAAVAEFNRLGHRTSVHLHIDDNWPEDLSPSQEIHCLHIVREALTNTLKHAQANNAVVSLQNRQTLLEISINDDGVGFGDELAKTDQFGLQIMTERSLRIGGRIEYQTLQAGGAS